MPSTAKCTLEHYTAFLLAEAQSAGCVRLSEVSGGEFAHDVANRFLNREAFSPRDLFEEMRPLIVWEEGVLSVDDTVLDKPYSQEGKTDLVGYFYSGLHGKAVKGINLVTLFYGEVGGMRVPVNFRVVDKAQGKTKNDLFREMVEEVLGWGVAPAIVTADSWYSSVENLRFLRDQGLSFVFALEKNRLVSEQRGEHVRVEDADLPECGKSMYLRHFGWVSVFRTVDKNNDVRHYAAFDPQKKRVKVAWHAFQQAHREHWAIEGYHRAIKQVCHAERFFVRCKQAIRNHSSVACARLSNSNPNAGAERSKAGMASNVTSPTQS